MRRLQPPLLHHLQPRQFNNDDLYQLLQQRRLPLLRKFLTCSDSLTRVLAAVVALPLSRLIYFRLSRLPQRRGQLGQLPVASTRLHLEAPLRQQENP